MKEWDEIESLFVQEMMDQHGEYIMDLLYDDIVSKKLRVTDDLIDSLNYKVNKVSNGYSLEISFLGYGRAIEIQYFKSKTIRREPSAKQDASSIRRTKKKDTRFYAKNVYGSINRLLGRLSSEYSDTEIERLKGILQNKLTT